MDPADLSVAGIGRALREGGLTARDVAEACLDRIARRDGRVRAFVSLDRARTLRIADRADAELRRGEDRGPLHGVPFAVKDLFDEEGLPNRCGSRARAASPSRGNAVAVGRLLAAGAVPLGRVATYEFALTGPSFDGPCPPAANPWDAGRITGGSSSGPAAAVAAGMVRIALGTDTGGSVRSPAAYCGVVGLKPTHGLVPLEGVQPLSPSLDHVGPLAATVSEAAAALEALAPGCGAASELGRGIDGLRVGYARDWFATDPETSPALLQAMDDAAAALSMLGARVALVALPDPALAEAAGAVILHAEALEVHAGALRRTPELYGRQARQSLAAGAGLTAEDVVRARRAGRRIAAGIGTVLGAQDVILTATTLGPAPPLPPEGKEQSVWTAMRTLAFNLTGHPALSLPAGFDDGLPLGMQLVGRHGAEATVCRAGAAFEAATGHSVAGPYLS